MEHEAGEGYEMQARQRLGQALVVARQAAEAHGPGEVPLDDPAARQEDEAARRSLGLGQFDDLEPDAGDAYICTACVEVLHEQVESAALLAQARRLRAGQAS